MVMVVRDGCWKLGAMKSSNGKRCCLEVTRCSLS
ncbi:ribosomal rna-processing protein 12, partial [Moniliophthora roreri]